MNYILNSIEEIQKIYIPDIEYLNDDFMGHSIDLEVFETKLDKLLTIEENRFVIEIKEELDKGNNIAFEMRLNNDIDNLDASHRFLNRISEDLNKFDKILIEKYKKSYKKVYEKLKKTYEHFVSNKNIFSFFGRDFSNDSSGNEIQQDLWDKMKKGQLFELNNINLQSTENTISENVEITNPFVKDDLKTIILRDFIDNFYKKELELVKQNYFNNQHKWSKSKRELVVFCKVIHRRRYTIKPAANMLPKIIKFFEKRYNINVGDQRKPSKHDLFEFDNNDFNNFEDKSNL